MAGDSWRAVPAEVRSAPSTRRRVRAATAAEKKFRRDGARGRSRTDTLLRAADFESAASTSSATRASRGARIIADRGATFQGSGASKQFVARLVDIDVAPDVLANARFGSERAQVAIYAALAPATFALLRRLAGSRTLAEDLFQETMMAVFEGLPAFRGEAPLGAWVRQIAVSKCLMYLRSPWHRARLRLTSECDWDPGTAQALLPAIPGPRAESLDVERALASLAPTARAVVWLFELEGYSHEEIAQSFGRSVSFSKSQLARAHVKLREWFEPRLDRQTCTTL
jgi:RNA polymerase sigma factor (sigma-70 family)